MDPPPAKKVRLTMACNECRRRKVKCDANYPSCNNCRKRKSDCFTSDPKKPDNPVQREWLEIPDKTAQTDSLPGHTQIPSVSIYRSEPERRDAALPFDESADMNQIPHGQHQPSPPIGLSPAINDHPENGAVAATTDFSPVHQPYDMSFNLDSVSNRFKMLGGSSSQCLSKSLDIYLKSCNVQSVSTLFRHGMAHSEEMELPLNLELLPFPDHNTRHAYLEAYFSRLHVFYPIFNTDDTRVVVHQIASIPDLKSMPYSKVPLLASAYLLMSIGADEVHGPSETGAKYLRVGAALVGHSVNYPYLTTVQSLLLLAICYRGRNKDGLAWHTTGMAVRTAQSMGLHRYSAARPSNQHGIQRRDQQLFHARVWAICCCLEKIGQLESGRPSAISVVNTDQMMGPDQRAPGHDFLQWNMALAEVQHDISTHLYGHQPGERNGREILLDSARLDKQLLAWPALVPAEFRPGNDILCSDEQFHFAAFLSFQYHQSVIAVHRVALVQPTATLQREINKLMPDNDSRFRLGGGEAICVSSARAIARITVELLERKLDSRLLSASPGLLACIVLAIYIVKNPKGRMQLSDLELLKATAEWTSTQFLKNGMDKQFSDGVNVICERVAECLSRRRAAALGTRKTSQSSAINNQNVQHEFNSSLHNGQTMNTQTNHGTMALDPAQNNHPSSNSGQGHVSGISRSSDSSLTSDALGRENSTMHIAHILLNDANHDAALGSMDQNIDLNTPPFENYNLEDLWNWMLLMDSSGDPGASDMGGWMDAGFEAP